MSSDDHTASRRLLVIIFVLFCTSLIAMCYVHALPPAPLVSIRTQHNSTSSVISFNASMPATNTTISNYIKGDNRFNRSHVGRQYSTSTEAQIITVTTNLSSCKDPNFEDGGPIIPNTTIVSLDRVESEFGPLLRSGGAFEPKNCTAKYHVAIVVPFRDRYGHLSIFLRHIHPFLMKQNIAYRIFIIEQTNGQSFNRASLLNVGFLEALKIHKWDCFIFHDVDLLPLDNRNIYNCPRQPRHMSVAIDTLNYKLPYSGIFGGVSAMTRKQFEAVNGFSNSYFGWGGEDDDMSNRIKHAGFFISRYPINIARYTMLKHQREKANPKRYEYLANSINKIKLDGLNSIQYQVYSIKDFPTFTWCLVELKIAEQKTL